MRNKMLTSDAIFKKNEAAQAQSDQPPFLANYISSLFVVWALIEAIAIAGIVLFLVSGTLIVPLILVAIGVSFKLFNGPRLEELMQLSSRYDSYQG